MTTTTVPTSTNPLQQIEQDRFAIACHQAAQIMARPEYNGRLEKAVDFVLSGSVTLHDDGTATVKSGSHTYYQLEPECTCMDSQQRSMYCKHFLAVELLKRTYERLGEHANGNGHQPLDPQPNTPQQPAWSCNQAPSSCTLKWTIGGIELMLTLRDGTDDALFGRIKRVLPRIEEKMEVQRQQRQQAQANNGNANGTSTSASNGHTGNGTAPAPNLDEPYCFLHEVPLKRFTKNGQTWYSHKAADGTWCHGK